MDKKTEKPRLEVEFLKNKLQAKLTNINILISKQNTSSSITMALIVGVCFPIFLYFGLAYFILSFLVIFVPWLIFSILRIRRLKKEKMRVFAIGSYIKGIYKEDLGVDVKKIEKVLHKLYLNAPKKTKGVKLR